MTKRGLTSVELFTGAGGLALGLAKAGFEHLAVVEWDKNACDTLRANCRHRALVAPWPVFEADVRQFDFAAYRGRVDLLAAGVPCQPFSLGGKHNGHRDRRNMFPEVARAIRALHPNIVIIENVKGLLRTKFRPYLDYVLMSVGMPELAPQPDENWWEHARRLQEAATAQSYAGLAYRVTFQLINCADFGVPQFRERVFLAAIRSDLKTLWTDIDPSHSEDALLWAQWVDGSYWKEHGIAAPKVPARLKGRIDRLTRGNRPSLKRWMTVRDALSGLPAPKPFQEHLTFDNHIVNPGARSYPGHTGSPYDWPAKTLKAGVHGVPGGENTLRQQNGRVRYFTVREAARLQTFPDDYRFKGAWCECMRQLGNAVPVAIGRVIGQQVRQLLSVELGPPRTDPRRYSSVSHQSEVSTSIEP